MKLLATGLLAAVVATTTCHTADAQRKRPGSRQRGRLLERIKSADKDKDGKITKTEFKALGRRLSRLFSRIDRNGDDVIDSKELKAVENRFRGRRNRGRRGGKRPGEVAETGKKAPDFKLKTLDGKRQVHLASFTGKKPVALIFGSYT